MSNSTFTATILDYPHRGCESCWKFDRISNLSLFLVLWWCSFYCRWASLQIFSTFFSQGLEKTYWGSHDSFLPTAPSCKSVMMQICVHVKLQWGISWYKTEGDKVNLQQEWCIVLGQSIWIIILLQHIICLVGLFCHRGNGRLWKGKYLVPFRSCVNGPS